MAQPIYPPPGRLPPNRPPAGGQPLGQPARPPRRGKTIAVVAIVVAIALVIGLTALFTSGFRCPPGQSYIDQGDCPQCFQGCVAPGMSVKPIIYLYPTEPTDVRVTVSHPELFTAQYPTYGDGWRVMATPDGRLIDGATGRDLYALYYESTRIVPAHRTDQGFVVPGDQTASFLEQALPQLGLSPREAEEFIVYWLPILQDNPYSYIRFESAAEQAANQALTITPAPDTVIRVMMDWRRLDQPITVTPQVLTSPARQGFVAVEWGGTEITG